MLLTNNNELLPKGMVQYSSKPSRRSRNPLQKCGMYVYQLNMLLTNNNEPSTYRYGAEAVNLAGEAGNLSRNVDCRQKSQNPTEAPIVSRNWVCISIKYSTNQ